MKLTKLIIASLVLALAAHPCLAGRDKGGKKGGGKPPRSQAKGFSAGEAANKARRKSGGRVLSVKPSSKGYRVKVLTPSGEVRYENVRGR